MERRIALLRERKESKEYRGQLLTLHKDSEEKKVDSKHYPSFDKPLLLRLDYSIVRQRVDYPSLTGVTGTVSEVVLLGYSLSSIKKEVFTNDEVSHYIGDGYRLL